MQINIGYFQHYAYNVGSEDAVFLMPRNGFLWWKYVNDNAAQASYDAGSIDEK